MFLEPLSRSIAANDELTGVKRGETCVKSSNFADDTVALLRGYRQLSPLWKELGRFCDPPVRHLT